MESAEGVRKTWPKPAGTAVCVRFDAITGDSSQMSVPSALQQFLDDLYLRRARGIKLGLDSVRALLTELGDPHQGARIVHVAGTNGKGSVVAMLDSILRSAGHRSGRYTSPHLIRFNERLTVSGSEISDDELYALLQDVERSVQSLDESSNLRKPTFFEFTTAAGFLWFQRQGADPWILETGLGGRLDATNVVDPIVTAITSIGIDHASFLGNTIEEVAGEKAGIIKPGIPVVLGRMHAAATRTIAEAASTRGAEMILAENAVSIRKKKEDREGQWIEMETASRRYRAIRLPLVGSHQLENAAVAVAVAEILSRESGVQIDENAVADGLESVSWSGRGEFVSHDPPVLLDCAHNPAGATALVEMAKELWPGRPIGLVVGFSKEKDAEGFLRTIGSHFDRVWVVELRNPAKLPLDDILAAAERAGVQVEACELPKACREAIDWANQLGHGAVCIAGSVYLAGEFLERFPG